MIIDHIRNWEQYSFGPAWEIAFDFLSGLKPDAEEKKYWLDGEAVYAMVMSYPKRNR